jgi:hypothetical protein
MSGAISPLPQYAFMAWCSVKAQRQLYLYMRVCVCVCVYMRALAHTQALGGRGERHVLSLKSQKMGLKLIPSPTEILTILE